MERDLGEATNGTVLGYRFAGAAIKRAPTPNVVTPC